MSKIKLSRNLIIFGTLFILAILASYLFAGSIEQYVLNENTEFLKGSSLFLVALVIGIIDGFNPCAMWVLIYLITLVSELKDRRKMWLVVGTFLLASGVVYYIILSLYLAGWELAIYLGYSSWVMKIAGIFALVSGAYFLYDFIKSGGKLECEVGDLQSKKKTRNRIKELVQSPFTIPVFFGLVVLAFSINLAEFFCSIGLPQLFTNILSISNITLFEQGIYMLIYIIAFMGDDLLIFYLALKAIDSPELSKYSGLSKLIGGIVMLAIGIVILFFPNLLL